MVSTKRTVFLAALALLAFVYHAAIGVNSDHGATKAYAINVNANGDDTASIPERRRRPAPRPDPFQAAICRIMTAAPVGNGVAACVTASQNATVVT